MKHSILIAFAALSLGGCATNEFSAGMTASPHYMASGHVGTAKAWVYAQRTLFQGQEGQEYQFSRPTGEAIPVEKIGTHYCLPFIERDFVVSQGVHTMRFVLAPATWTFAHTGATHETPQQ